MSVKTEKYPALARIFSISGKIFRPERCSLSDALFQNLMFIRYNTDFTYSYS